MAGFGNAEEAPCVSPSPDVSADKLNAFVRVTSSLVAASAACGTSGITHDCVSSVTALSWLTQSQGRLTEVLARASPCVKSRLHAVRIGPSPPRTSCWRALTF
jgi:hypothetical protein